MMIFTSKEPASAGGAISISSRQKANSIRDMDGQASTTALPMQ
jgi:hypothetical protein